MIIDDTTPPTVAGPLDAVTSQCPITVADDLNKPSPPSDNCTRTVTVSLKNDISIFPIAKSGTITWVYTDEEGNTSEQTQNVIIDDTTPPTVAGPLDAVTSQCPITVADDLNKPSPPSDNCTRTVTVSLKNDVSIFPIAKSGTITWVYTDEEGNTSDQVQQVTIIDTQAPTPVNPSLSTITEKCQVTEKSDLMVPTATDNCDDGEITATTNTAFPITVNTTITWIYEDNAGNIAIQTQQVTIDDDTSPTPDPNNNNNLSEITRQCPLSEAELTAMTATTATDNCSGTTTVANDITSFLITESTMITWTYTDAAGNTTTQTQQVTINDNQPPIPDNSNLPTITEGCPVEKATDLIAPTATDNCNDGRILATTDVSFPITSTTTIIWTYTDAAGNTATQTQQVTCPLGVADNAAEVAIFPNPSGSYLEVRSAVGVTFQLLSLSGKPLMEGTANTKMDISSLKSGLYLVQLPDGRLLKFVKE